MNIRENRKSAGISQAELARRTGIAQPKLSKIETELAEPTSGEIALIVAALDEAKILSNREVQAAVEDAIPSLEEFEAEVSVLQPYPAAPGDSGARRVWVTQRTRNMEQGFPSPSTGSFGGVKKGK